MNGRNRILKLLFATVNLTLLTNRTRKNFFCFIVLLELMSCNPKHNLHVTPSIVVKGLEENEMNEFFNPFATDEHDSISISFNVIKTDGTNNSIQVSFAKQADTLKTEIERIGSLLHSNDNIFFDTNKNTAYLCWISEPFYNPNSGAEGTNKNRKYELYLKVLDINSKIEIFSDKIFETACCLERLSMKFNPYTNSILFAYNDFSRPDDKDLMLGSIQMENNKVKSKILNPIAVVLQDKSEKRFPQFLNDTKNLFLYHSSGDRWGFFEHKGKQQIGISKVDSNNQLTDYRIITDSCAIDNKLILKNDTVYFRVRIENKSGGDEMKIKKVALKDLQTLQE